MKYLEIVQNLTIVQTLAMYWMSNNIHHRYIWHQRVLCNHHISCQTNNIRVSYLRKLGWPKKFNIPYIISMIMNWYRGRAELGKLGMHSLRYRQRGRNWVSRVCICIPMFWGFYIGNEILEFRLYFALVNFCYVFSSA